jgi:hypothetical protein
MKKNVREILFLLHAFFFVYSGSVFAKDVWPFDKTALTLKDGRKIKLDRMAEENTWRLSLRNKKGDLVWSKNYSEDFDSLWHYAYFVRVKGNNFVYDLNKDGYPKIALSTWDGGNAPTRPAIIFTVREKDLVVFKIVKKYLIESEKAVFK